MTGNISKDYTPSGFDRFHLTAYALDFVLRSQEEGTSWLGVGNAESYTSSNFNTTLES